MMRKIPISGGPHTGKTTLLRALRFEYPEAFFVDEPAEIVIASEIEKEENSQSYQGVFPLTNYPEFARLAVDKSVELEKAIPEDSKIVFQDRCLIDNIGYGRLNGHEELVSEIDRRVKMANYAFALFCEPVGVYTPTLIRRETPEQAQNTHEYLARAYAESGIEVITLPSASTEERLALVAEAIRSA